MGGWGLRGNLAGMRHTREKASNLRKGDLTLRAIGLAQLRIANKPILPMNRIGDMRHQNILGG